MIDRIKKLIDENEYENALRLLLEEEGHYLLKIQCLFEIEQFDQVIDYFDQIVSSIEEDYFEIFGYYILALLKNNEFEKALTALNDELSMPYIQNDYEEVLNNLYDDVLAQKQAYLVENGAFDKGLSEEEFVETINNKTDYTELLSAITKLEDFNIRKLLPSLEAFLQADRSPVLKTFILEVMIKQQVSDVVLVIKDDIEYEFVAVANQMVFQDVNYIKTRSLLEDHLQKYPSYLIMSLDVLDVLAYILYPTTIDIDEVEYIAALIEYYVFSLNIDDLQEDFEKYYDINIDLVINNVDWLINKLQTEERFSSDTI